MVYCIAGSSAASHAARAIARAAGLKVTGDQYFAHGAALTVIDESDPIGGVRDLLRQLGLEAELPAEPPAGQFSALERALAAELVAIVKACGMDMESCPAATDAILADGPYEDLGVAFARRRGIV